VYDMHTAGELFGLNERGFRFRRGNEASLCLEGTLPPPQQEMRLGIGSASWPTSISTGVGMALVSEWEPMRASLYAFGGFGPWLSLWKGTNRCTQIGKQPWPQ
jgi:hypothetical protein